MKLSEAHQEVLTTDDQQPAVSVAENSLSLVR